VLLDEFGRIAHMLPMIRPACPSIGTMLWFLSYHIQ
jgi:hypothetical protein